MGIQQVKNTPQAQESDTPMESKPLFKKMDPTLLLDHQPQQQLMLEQLVDTQKQLDLKQPQEHSTSTILQDHMVAQKQEKPQSQEIFATKVRNPPELHLILKEELVSADMIIPVWMMVQDALKRVDICLLNKKNYSVEDICLLNKKNYSKED